MHGSWAAAAEAASLSGCAGQQSDNGWRGLVEPAVPLGFVNVVRGGWRGSSAFISTFRDTHSSSRWSWPGSLLPHSCYVWSLFPHRSPTPLNASLFCFRSACFFPFLFFLTAPSTCLNKPNGYNSFFTEVCLFIFVLLWTTRTACVETWEVHTDERLVCVREQRELYEWRHVCVCVFRMQ